ncbi:TenA family protein [Actinoplanes sp. NPDC049596]|uniref:TenA family protein n=1 Tax=unclassified Actinoplanes TaxID=2626549 RepID=UPI003413FC2B
MISQWWEDIGDLRVRIDELPFVRGLGDGTLDSGAFVWYLEQDALYLRGYARVVAGAARLAPAVDEQAFWAASAQRAIAGERQLHESWGVREAEPAAVTIAYLDHLSAQGDYRVLIAALLPCFWLYHDVGSRLHPLSHAGHPYRSWLDTYADEMFAQATEEARVIVTRAAAHADDLTRTAMHEAFRISATHEHAFFAAPHQQIGQKR